MRVASPPRSVPTTSFSSTRPAPRSSTPRPGAIGQDRYTSPPPSLLRAFGIKAAEVDPAADILTMRPGLSGTSDMQLVYGNYFSGSGSQGGGRPGAFPARRATA